MIQIFINKDGQTVEIDQPESDSWVNLVPPFKDEEFVKISEELDIPIEFLRDSLDIDERPRFEKEDNARFLVIKTPTENNSFSSADSFYFTIPICIILTHNQIVTVNSFDNGAIKKFLNTFQNRQPDQKNMMVLKIFEKIIQNYMEYLKEIYQKMNAFERDFYEKNNSEDLVNLMRIQKSLVYFVTALKSNEIMLRRLSHTNFLKLNEQEMEYLEDLLVDSSQALEMSHVYTNILNTALNTYASIVNNNSHRVVKRLTTITAMIAAPTLLASLYSMNVRLPFAGDSNAFWLILGLAILFSGGIYLLLERKK